MAFDAANPYDQVRRHILVMGEMAERNTQAAVMALVDRDNEMAADAISYDREVDEVEVALDALCVEILDHRHPTGEELRLVVGAMKICACLERISDLAVEIAGHVLILTAKRSVLREEELKDFAELLETVTGMMRDAIEALQSQDVDLCWRILDEGEAAGDRREALENMLLKKSRANAKLSESVLHLVIALRALQRIADQASDVAEEVIFIVTGNVVKHHHDEFRPKPKKPPTGRLKRIQPADEDNLD